MAFGASAGYLAGQIAEGLNAVKPAWRARLLWLASPAASRVLITGAAVAVMAISIVVTSSRSGLLALVGSLCILAGWVVRRQPSRGRKTFAIGYLLFVVIAAASWGRLDTVLARFETASEDPRFAIWQDTITIIRDFPLTGTGLNTYGIAMLKYQTVHDGFSYTEAHNDYLQLGAEGGLLLGIPAFLTLLLFIREIWLRFREGADDMTTYWLRAGAVTGLCAIAMQEVTDFTLQMPGAAVLFVVLAAIAIHKPDYLRQEGAPQGAHLRRRPGAETSPHAGPTA
jgi:O-antigen ligase